MGVLDARYLFSERFMASDANPLWCFVKTRLALWLEHHLVVTAIWLHSLMGEADFVSRLQELSANWPSDANRR